MAAESWRRRSPARPRAAQRCNDKMQHTGPRLRQGGRGQGRAGEASYKFSHPAYCFPIPFGVSAYFLLTFLGGMHVKGTCPACPPLHCLQMTPSWDTGGPAGDRRSRILMFALIIPRLSGSEAAGVERERQRGRNLHGHVI